MSEQKELPFLGLSIIVKNEEKVIKRMLDSVAPILDWYTIIDTGSTDRTKEIAKEVMDSHGIPGEIIDHEWVNFCTARNFAFESTKGKCQFGFWIDADEQLILEPGFNKSAIRKTLQNIDHGAIRVNYGSQSYFRTQFHNLDYPFEWRGAVHEIQFPLENAPHPVRSAEVKGMSVLVTPDGASWGDRSKEAQIKKYLDHAELLHEYIKTDKDVRWIFYLAQSYRDAFVFDKAEEWYAKRVEMGGGYWEELYFSQLMVASMKAQQRKPAAEVIEAYAECAKYDPNRAEHFIPMIKHYQLMKNWPMSYAISKHCYENLNQNPFPKSSLFIEKSTYDWSINDLHSVNCFYMKDLKSGKAAYAKAKKAVMDGLVENQNEAKRIIENEKWFVELQKQMIQESSRSAQPVLNKQRGSNNTKSKKKRRKR